MLRQVIFLISLICVNISVQLSAQEPTYTKLGKGPLKVFILAGQSNMEGKGKIEHIKMAAQDESTRQEFSPLMNGDNYVVRKDVWISYGNRRGGLSVGYGTNSSMVGPELGFGWHIGELLGEQVLLIKTAWGGHSLKEKFLPPSMGGPGLSYTEMVKDVHNVLDNLKNYFPEYDERMGFEMVGLVWHQAWNDMIDGQQKAESPPYKLYTERQAALLRDLRKEFNSPNMLMTIGECGVGGGGPNNFRKAQEATALLDEFVKTVRFVKTAQFWDEDERFKTNGGYHYNGNGKIYYFMGKAMALAMYDMMPKVTFQDVKSYLDDKSKPAYEAIKARKFPEAVAALNDYQKFMGEQKGQVADEQFGKYETVYDVLTKELYGAINPGIEEVAHLKTIKDYYALSLVFTGLNKALKGVPAFDEAAGDLESQLKSKEVMTSIKIGKEYYKYMEKFKEMESQKDFKRTEEHAKGYEKYLDKYIIKKSPDSVYAKAAQLAIDELKDLAKPMRNPGDYVSVSGK